jgi:predicted amidohydrolase
MTNTFECEMTSFFEKFFYDEESATKELKIATVAMQCDREPAANRARLVEVVRDIKKNYPDVELVVFGEVILSWYNPEMVEYHRKTAESIPGITTKVLSRLANEFDIYISFGLSEVGPGRRLFNSQVLINPAGEIQAVHRKRCPKSDLFSRGSVPVTVTEIKGVRTGIVICSDAANPRTIWELMVNRLELIIISLADDCDENLFMAKFNARMYDAWVVTANRYGDQEGYFWNGHIVVSNPLGMLKATSQDVSGYLVFNLRFDTNHGILKRFIRNLVVKAPLPFNVGKNWRRLLDYT